MNPERLTNLLAAGANAEPPGPSACPDEHLIAGYVDGGLDDDSRAGVELHLADCGRCLKIVGSLCRERRPAGSEVPVRRTWQSAPWWAAAATVVLAVPFALHFSRNLDSGDAGQGRPPAPAVRTFGPDPASLRVLSPLPGSATDPQQLAFRWTEVAGSPFYDVRIVTDAGDVVIGQREDYYGVCRLVGNDFCIVRYQDVPAREMVPGESRLGLGRRLG